MQLKPSSSKERRIMQWQIDHNFGRNAGCGKQERAFLAAVAADPSNRVCHRPVDQRRWRTGNQLNYFDLKKST